MRLKRVLIGAAVVAVIAVAAWSGREAYATARLGTVYVSKQFCSCLFVARRSYESCLTDYDPRDLAALTVERGESGVRTSALWGLVSARAEFEPAYGCHPVD